MMRWGGVNLAVPVMSRAVSATVEGTRYGCVPIRGYDNITQVCIWDDRTSFGVLTSGVTASPQSALDLVQAVHRAAT